jgi:hypothetical protein
LAKHRQKAHQQTNWPFLALDLGAQARKAWLVVKVRKGGKDAIIQLIGKSLVRPSV